MIRQHGLLLYTPEDAARNRWFIAHLCDSAEPEGVSLRLCLSENGHPAHAFSADTAFLVNRSRCYKYSSYAEEIIHIPCFNSRFVTGVTNHKYMTYRVLHGEHGIPMADTWQIGRHAPLPDLQFPLVAKPDDGHGGADVRWIADAAALERYREAFNTAHPEPDYPFLVQEPMVTGWDVRVYVLGGEIYAAVLRTSDSDFRSNFSLGGHAALFEPDAEMRELVERICKIMPLDFAGVDFLRHPSGGYVLGEIEDAVGCRMLYELTDRDPVRDYAVYLGQRMHTQKHYEQEGSS